MKKPISDSGLAQFFKGQTRDHAMQPVTTDAPLRQSREQRQALPDMRARILSIGEELIRKRGYNGFSYADIAKVAKISKAGVHHHFKAKSDLAVALVRVTHQDLEDCLRSLSNHPPLSALKVYIARFEDALVNDLVCLDCMLLAETDSLPDNLVAANRQFVDWQLGWLEELLADGSRRGIIRLTGTPRSHAELIYAIAQGSHLFANMRESEQSFRSTIDLLLAQLRNN